MSTENVNRAYNAIKTFVIFSAENPECTLLEHMKSANYCYAPVECSWSRLPKQSFMVINIDVNACKFFCGKYQQTPFIYSELSEEGRILSYYYAKAAEAQPYHPKRNDYVVKDTCDEAVEYICRAEDGYMVFGHSFMYSIQFSLFDIINQTINNNIDRILVKDGKEDTPQNRNYIIEFASRGAGQSPYLWRKALYKGL